MAARRSRAEEPRHAHLHRMREACRRHGLPLTAKRRLILETIADLGTHPTADEVHAAATARDPSLGRATVYRALESFVTAGALTKASHTGAAVRYDAVVDRHHHLVCLRCDRIVDVTDPRLDAVRVPDTSASGFEVLDVQVQILGTCQKCLEEEETP